MPTPSQIYVDDSGKVHVSYPCESCSEWVHTDDHCGDTLPDGRDEYMCGDCYGTKRGDFGGDGCTCADCEAFRPRVDGTVIDGKWVCSDCTHDRRAERMYIHDWLIMTVDFDWVPGVLVAIHKDVATAKTLDVADCSSPNPEDNISRFGPGACAVSLEEIDALHHDVNSVYCLVDSGYIDGKKAHLIFKEGGAA